ncbi:MAG: UMP kinase, partial [Alphaproteobacteria bacterium]|nr:UMP kinase [Alphaproteobacteria bacterium]
QVDGVYTADPKTDKTAERFESLSYLEVLTRNLKVMDASAVSLSRENRIPIIVFSIHDRGALSAVLCGGGRATVIEERISAD